MSMTFKEQSNLKVGDVLWESTQCGNIKFKVKTVTIDQIELDGKIHQQVYINGTDRASGKEVEFMTTEGLEHYGAKLCWEPKYDSFDDIREQLRNN